MHGRFQRYSATETGQSVARLEGLARLMDGVFVLPGTNIRLGLDVTARPDEFALRVKALLARLSNGGTTLGAGDP